MKKLAILVLCLFLGPPQTVQDPVNPKRDNIYVEFLADCNWLIWELEGKIKLKADIGNYVGFRAWEPYREAGTIEFRGHVVYRELPYLWGRDYLVMSHSAFIGDPPNAYPWNYGIHYNELGGNGFSNAGAIMRVWGPCKWVRLYHGEAMVKHGDKTEYIKVDENNYLLYPIWEISLN